MKYENIKRCISMSALLLIGGLLLLGCAPAAEDLLPTVEVTYSEMGPMYVIEGYDAEFMTWTPPTQTMDGQFYFANPYFLDVYFEDHFVEGSADWVDEQMSAVRVSFVEGEGRGSGMANAPRTEFVVDLDKQTVIDQKSDAYEEENVQMSEEAMVQVGRMIAQIMREAQEYHIERTENQ